MGMDGMNGCSLLWLTAYVKLSEDTKTVTRGHGYGWDERVFPASLFWLTAYVKLSEDTKTVTRGHGYGWDERVFPALAYRLC